MPFEMVAYIAASVLLSICFSIVLKDVWKEDKGSYIALVIMALPFLNIGLILIIAYCSVEDYIDIRW